MNHTKRERLERLIAGERADRPGVALWRHWPGDNQDPVELARSTLDWQEQFDFDFVKVTPDSNFCVGGWGADSVWVGGDEGSRTYVAHPVHAAADWLRLQPQDPAHGRLGGQVQCLEIIGQGLPARTPFIQTIFSPTSQLKYLAGGDQVLAELREHPQEVEAALTVITETTLRFLEAMAHTGAAGIYFAVQLAAPGQMTPEEYVRFGRPHDLAILAAASQLYWFNLLHLHGAGAYFDLFRDYPVQCINWHDREAGPSLSEAQARTGRALSGGLRQWETMVRGTPASVAAEAADAIAQTEGRGFILSTGCVTPITSPMGNIRAARRAVED